MLSIVKIFEYCEVQNAVKCMFGRSRKAFAGITFDLSLKG